MSAVSAILACLCGSADDAGPADQKAAYADDAPNPADDELAREIVDIFRNADENGHELKAQVSGVIHPQSWTENIAKAVLRALEPIIKEGRDKVGRALGEAIATAEAAATACFTFSKEHPYLTAGFVTIVAVGVLVWMAPWAVEALGFGELGPIGSMLLPGLLVSEAWITHANCLPTDSFAAIWQRTYAGFIPKGSLFSFLQRLGMTWK